VFTRSSLLALCALVALALCSARSLAQHVPPRPPSLVPLTPPRAPDLAARARSIADEARLLRQFPIDLQWGTR